MWKTRAITPSVRSNVIYVTDRKGSIYSFPLVRNRLSLKLLRLTFQGATGLCYCDSTYLRYWDEPQADEQQVKQYSDVKLVKGIFRAPPGGWFYRGRTFYVKVDTGKKSDVMAVEMLRRYQAITCGVTLYFEQKKEETHRIVAAIDFGTSFSGYAYSFGNAPTTVFTNDWTGEGMLPNTEKAPTTVLLNPDRKFHCFGYEAEDEYALLVDGEVFYDWFYVRNFKMKLYQNKDLRRDTTLRDIDGKQLRALDIFTMAIRYMKHKLMNELRAKPLVKAKDVEWVITVPAIWSDAAKQFMREAAENAGIAGDSLKLVLEPEAASLFCKSLKLDGIEVISGSLDGRSPFYPGRQYILLDLGGGTADLSAHEILGDGSLREIRRATGGAQGGNTVDEAFNKFMGDLVGPDVMMDFFRDYRQDYIKFMRDFEAKKRMPVDLTSNIVFELPTCLINILSRQHDTSIEEAVMKSDHAKDITVKGRKMMLNGKIMQRLFRKTLAAIVSYIKEMKIDPRLRDTRMIVLAGGFSECGHVRNAVKTSFPDHLILSPREPGLAILKGAVLMGHRPEAIVERVARYTYGVNFARKPFFEGEDPPELRAIRNGDTYCDDVFEKLVEIGQPIRYTDVFTVRRKSTLTSRQSKFENLYTKLYASLDPNPEYCTEDCDCVKIGEIVRSPPKDGWPDELTTKIEIKFGETEMNVQIIEESTKTVYKARIDSL